MAKPNHGAGSNNAQAQLGTAYQELGTELSTSALKVVGGYTLGRVIGEGTFGSVHIATHRLTGTRCAVKKIPKSATAHLTRELHHHRRLHHPNIVHLHEIVATESHVWLVTELCSGGELFDYLVERGRIYELEARRMFGELVVAVGYLHRHGVVHRDLKLENIFLDGEMRIKLGDLGFAREYQKGRLMETFCGTTGYASPEMLACRKYLGPETDIWSLGVILYTLLCGGLPFDSDDEREMKDLISKGEYEEPDWLSEDARMLIKSMLQLEPSLRPTIEDILSHSWFKATIDHIPSHPPTPNITQDPTAFTDSFSPEAGTVQLPAPNLSPRSSHMHPSPDSAPITRVHSGEFSQTERELELLHGTSPAPVSSSPDTSGAVEGEDALSPMEENALHLPLPSHSRTPSRTKRRSVSSQLSMERRLSHHSISGHWHHSPIDYLARLNEDKAELLTRPSEKHLLSGLNALGFDTGQLVHSVTSDACDASAATWWILRMKQIERGETDEAVEAMNSSAARRRERAAAFARDERKKARESADPDAISRTEVTFMETPGTLPNFAISDLGPPVSIVNPAAQSPSPAPPLITTQLAQPVSIIRSPDTPTTPDTASRLIVGSPTPSPETSRLKTRSPSMSMLQRATSALTGKKVEEKVFDDERSPDGRTSPTKLVKSQPRLKSKEEASLTGSPASSVTITSPVGTIKREHPPSNLRPGSPVDPTPHIQRKPSKRDSLWTTFRHMFVEDRRRKRSAPFENNQIKIAPAVVLSRGPAARSPHVNRVPQPGSRRASNDVRPPLHSRRSSSLNSRRSSFTSSQVPADVQDSLAALGRRTSHRSHGSQTPTSDREFLPDYPSRPSSSTSLHRGSSRRSSHSLNVRSPSLHSDHSNRFPPPSPLHKYQRRSASGFNSTRVQHIKIIPEAQILRTSSVASSVRSNNSSRRSSIERREDLSDHDSRDDVSLKSFKRKDNHSLAQQIHRTRSPLVHGHRIIHRPKPPIRDVFQQKDEDWIDEDEIPAFEGGLGQAASSSWEAQKGNKRESSFPGATRRSGREQTTMQSVEEGKVSSNRDNPNSRRAGVPDRKPPMVMEEVEEEEEE